MPFTPFHFGPGALLKSVAPRYFSFSLFCFAQGITDIEVLVHMARNDSRLHDFCHTFIGAAAVGLFSLAIGRPFCQRVLRWWTSQPNMPLKEYYIPNARIPSMAAASGAFLGAFSHVILDAIMHSDLRPLWPWNSHNYFYAFLGPGTLHALCFVLGVLGIVLWARARRRKL